MSALVCSWFFDGPPSTRYDARVKGAPAKPMSGVAPSSPASSRTDSVMSGTSSGREVAQLPEVGARPDRVRDDRADAGDDVQVDPDGRERHDDVGEEDGRVDAVPSHRLQGDLGDEVGAPARLEHADALAHGAVLGERAPRLAHEPHRGAWHAAAAERLARGRRPRWLPERRRREQAPGAAWGSSCRGVSRRDILASRGQWCRTPAGGCRGSQSDDRGPADGEDDPDLLHPAEPLVQDDPRQHRRDDGVQRAEHRRDAHLPTR